MILSLSFLITFIFGLFTALCAPLCEFYFCDGATENQKNNRYYYYYD